MARKFAALILWSFCFFVCFAPITEGQVSTATILDTVKDETQAILPGVKITVKNLDTGISRVVVTDDEGRYHAPNLALGNYEVQAELQGFQTGIRTGIKLTVGREAIVDLTLKVGEITEKLVVTGAIGRYNQRDHRRFGR